MNRIRAIMLHLLLLWMLIASLPAAANVYIIIYATHDGKTGHAGIAIDKYDILVRDETESGERCTAYDSVRTGRLVYYDLWPKTDGSDKALIAQDIEPLYFKLPAASWEREITLATLSRKGIPHREDYPCDGLIRLKTCPAQDFRLCRYLDDIVERKPMFNALRYNCADFVAEAVEFLIGKKLNAKEQIFYARCTTPNRLYQEISKLQNAVVLKDPGDKINGSFLMERILKRNP